MEIYTKYIDCWHVNLQYVNDTGECWKLKPTITNVLSLQKFEYLQHILNLFTNMIMIQHVCLFYCLKSTIITDILKSNLHSTLNIDSTRFSSFNQVCISHAMHLHAMSHCSMESGTSIIHTVSLILGKVDEYLSGNSSKRLLLFWYTQCYRLRHFSRSG